MPSAVDINFQRLREQVLAKRPVLREILQKRGGKTLFDYAKLYIDVNLNPPLKRRQNEFINTFKEQVAEILTPELAESAAKQLEHYYFVSTVDHHGPLCHPFFINGNLLTAAPHFEKGDPILQNIIVLPCSSISLNNSSFPRGLIFNTYVDGKVETQRLSFFPASDRQCPVYNYRPYTVADIQRAKSTLADLQKSGKVPLEIAQKVNGLIDEIYLKPEMLEAKDFSEQITKTNLHLWQKFFASSNLQGPNLIYLEQESLVKRLLMKYHIYQHTIITHFLFDLEYESLFMQYFDGIAGAFSTKDKWGTYLFWGLPKGAKYRMQLWKEGNFLVSDDGSYRLELTPDNVARALETNEIIPGPVLCYMLLSFYYGLKCLGGFSQVNYLTLMKNAYIKMQVDLGNYRSIEVCARAQTKEMGADFTIAFLGGPGGELVPATGLDLILYGTEKTWPMLAEESKKITLQEGVDSLMPEFYRILYPEQEREADLMAVTPEDITKLNHLDERIEACVQIKN